MFHVFLVFYSALIYSSRSLDKSTVLFASPISFTHLTLSSVHTTFLWPTDQPNERELSDGASFFRHYSLCPSFNSRRRQTEKPIQKALNCPAIIPLGTWLQQYLFAKVLWTKRRYQFCSEVNVDGHGLTRVDATLPDERLACSTTGQKEEEWRVNDRTANRQMNWKTRVN